MICCPSLFLCSFPIVFEEQSLTISHLLRACSPLPFSVLSRLCQLKKTGLYDLKPDAIQSCVFVASWKQKKHLWWRSIKMVIVKTKMNKKYRRGPVVRANHRSLSVGISFFVFFYNLLFVWGFGEYIHRFHRLRSCLRFPFILCSIWFAFFC